MSKRDEFESILMGVYPVNNTKLYGALEAALEEAFDEGHDEGTDEGYDQGTLETHNEYRNDPGKPFENELQARYHYLKHGGQWQMDLPAGLEGDQRTAAEKNYVAGFLDAMNILGVKP